MEKLPGARCDSCPLRTRTLVSSRGAPDADIAFVGEAPGANEVTIGRPFVGISGQLLRKVTDSIGLSTTRISTHNAIACGMVRGDDEKEMAMRCCFERLVRELEQRKGHLRTIVAFGNYAIESLIGVEGSKGVTKTHCRISRPHDKRLEGITVIPALHPAAVLRAPDYFGHLRFAIEKAKWGMNRWSILNEGYNYEVVETVEDALRVIGLLGEKQVIALDLETSSLNKLEGKILCISLCADPKMAYVIRGDLLYDDRVKADLRSLLVRPVKEIVAHNAAFDMLYIWQQLGFQARETWDTMLMHYTGDETKGTHSLKDLSRIYFDAPDYDDVIWQYTKRRSDDTNFGKVPWPLLAKYNAQDGIYTYRLFLEMKQELDKDPRRARVYDLLLRPASWTVVEMEKHGVWIDLDHLDAIEVKFEDRLTSQLFKVRKMTGDREFNPASPQQVARYVYDILQLPVLREWGRTTQYDAMILMKDAHPFITEFLEWRRLAKMYNTYIEPMADYIDRDGRVRPDIQLHGTTTGRLVMRKPALMTVMRPGTDEGKDIRNLFGVPNDKTMVEVDYSQNELRVAASLSQDPYLLDVYRTGRDLHSETSIRVFGNDTGGTEQRHSVKRMTFGLLYGRGIESLMTELRDTGWDRDGARKYVDRFFDTIKDCVAWIEGVKYKALAEGYVETIFGRRRNFPLIVPDNRAAIQREAANMHPQSVGSDLTLISMARVQKMLKMNDYGSVALMIHDSLICEINNDCIHDAVEKTKEIMLEVPAEFIPNAVPWQVDAKVGRRWGALR